MEIGISKVKGNIQFTSTSKAFREEYGIVREVPEGCLFSIMNDLANWANNEAEEECFFYMN